MPKLLIHLIGIFLLVANSNAQSSNQKILFVLDSIPVINDPEPWNQIQPHDIADITVIKNKDSLKVLGWGDNLDGIVYVFTRAYRSRPDSLKKIPSLKQMEYLSDAWHLHGQIYSGRYIDYYNNGTTQNEGNLVDGKLDGPLRIYYKSGRLKSSTEYKNGLQNGTRIDYYKNGSVYSRTEYRLGKETANKTYYVNGQLETEIRLRRNTHFDTLLHYYSNGKIYKQALRRNGYVMLSKKQENINYYTTMLTSSLRKGDIKEANKLFYHLWLLDSSSMDTKLQQGILALYEARYDDAISAFDRALELEPLLRPALEQRAVARIRKNMALKTISYSRPVVQFQLTADDLMMLPPHEFKLVCEDVLKSDAIDPNSTPMSTIIPEPLMNLCREKKMKQ